MFIYPDRRYRALIFSAQLKIATQTLIILSSPSSIRALIDKGSASIERPRIRLAEITLDGMNVALAGDGK